MVPILEMSLERLLFEICETRDPCLVESSDTDKRIL